MLVAHSALFMLMPIQGSVTTPRDDESIDNVSDLTETNPLPSSEVEGLAAGKSTKEQQRTRDSDVVGSRKKRATGGTSSIVLG